MKNMVDITHLYFGTAGAAGLYTHKIHEALKDNFRQDCIVNYYFPFGYGRKYFFRLTELSGPNVLKSSKYLRFFVRYLELVVGLLRSSALIAKNGCQVVNYNLISQHKTEYVFLLFWKRLLGKKIIITLHDVVPFAPQYRSFVPANHAKQKIIGLADYVLVHNQNSVDDFHSAFSCRRPIVQHPFPIMDLRDMFGPASPGLRRRASTDPFTFLFVGHARVEKGLDVLVQAWKLIDASAEGCRLIVASNIDKRLAVYDELCAMDGVDIRPGFVSDKTYYDLIASCDCVVLPYKRGTNSGIPGSVLSLGAQVLCSNISMFQNNRLIPRDAFFQTENPDSMATKMLGFVRTSRQPRAIATSVEDEVVEYEREFRAETVAVYSAFLQHVGTGSMHTPARLAK